MAQFEPESLAQIEPKYPVVVRFYCLYRLRITNSKIKKADMQFPLNVVVRVSGNSKGVHYLRFAN